MLALSKAIQALTYSEMSRVSLFLFDAVQREIDAGWNQSEATARCLIDMADEVQKEHENIEREAQ